MQENRPRRSRRTPPKGGGSLPFVPVIIGVVIFGFVVGAGLSVVGKRGSDSAALPVSTSAPRPADTYAEVTPAPQPTDRPEVVQSAASATASAASQPSVAPSIAARATASAHANANASTHAIVAVAPTSTPRAAPRVAAVDASSPSAGTRVEQPTSRSSAEAATAAAIKPTAAPAAESKAASKGELATAPAAVSTAPPAVVTAPPAASAAVDADSDFARLAGNVVRQYLLALARGDTTSAYAVLSPGPGSGGQTPPELGALDSSLHIGRIEARGSDVAATVNVDLTTTNGPYYGQYTVHRSATGAAVIVSHTFGKP